ncbi:unnamed protein product [Lactuca virosa]|uniref:Uncharacterized protein n=1 Tax=Lactuca virosa TaxID=75947 RepID=A0AAU9NES7_9ASTR|nr:unnamed protein product [Lactuca virosa]
MSSGMMAYPARPFEETKDQKYLIDIVRSYYDDDELKHVSELDKLIDTDIKGKICMSYFHKFNEIAHMCINFNIKKCPTMDKIIEAIEEAQSIQESRKNFYMVGPNDLSITWNETAAYWELRHIPQSRFPEVWILRKVCWLEIHGKITVVKQLEKSTYVAYLILQTAENCRGLDVPANSSITFGGKKMETEKCLSSKTKG